MKKGLWNRRIPTTFAVFVLLMSILITSFLVQKGAVFISRAGPNKTPENVFVSNITDSSFTVNFTTEAQTVAGLSVEGGRAPFVVYDDRNKNASDQKPFFAHYITVSDLDPNTTYQFSILADGETYLDKGKKYSATTGEKITNAPPRQNPIVGNVLLGEGGPAGDTIVKIESPNGQTTTTYTNPSGEFVVPTNSIRNANLNGYLTLKPDDIITISALRESSSTSLKILFKNAGSIPTITLGQQYDFTNTSSSPASAGSSELKAPTTSGRSISVKIITPTASQSFIDTKPRFTGTAAPNQPVKITIESNPITAVVNADANGNWSFRPASNLAPGSHTITVEAADQFGIIRTISQSFTIFSSGVQVAQSATPSATPIVTFTPTPTRVLTPTFAPTPTTVPSVTISPSITTVPTSTPAVSLTPTISLPTAAPTIAPTIIIPTVTLAPPIVASPTTKPVAKIPDTGNNSSIVLTVISTIMIFAGATLLFLL